MNTPEETTTGENKPSIRSYLTLRMRDYGILLALIVIIAFFQIVTNGVLMRPVNITNLFLQNSYVIIMALGMLMIIVAGHIDLSVGSIVGFIGALAAVMIVHWQVPVIVAFFACIFAGMLIGAWQGYWVAYWRIPSFIVTLAGMLIFRGLSLWLLNGQSVGPFPGSFQLLSTGFVPDFLGPFPSIKNFVLQLLDVKVFNMTALVAGVIAAGAIVYLAWRSRARNVAYGIEEEPFPFFIGRNIIVAGVLIFVAWKLASFRGLPNVLISMAILTVIYTFITESTTFGRRVYAIGGNEKAAALSGINTKRLNFIVFVNMGMLAALAGLVFAARLNIATPKAGNGFELDVIAAVFIGGASMSGGVGKIVGAVVGAFIMGIMNNGMSIMGIGIDYQQVIKGLVLLAAVVFDVYNKNKA